MKKYLSILLTVLLISTLSCCATERNETVYTKDVLELMEFESVNIANHDIHFYKQYKDNVNVIGYLKQEHSWAIDYLKEKFNLKDFSTSSAEDYYIAISNLSGPDQRIVEFQSLISTLETKKLNDEINRLISEYENYQNKNDEKGIENTLEKLLQASAYH